MAIKDKKDSVNTRESTFTCVCTCKHSKNEKTQVATPDLWHLCVLFSVGPPKVIIIKKVLAFNSDSHKPF